MKALNAPVGRLRFQAALLALAFVLLSLSTFWLYRYASDARALVYVVAPDGRAHVIDNTAARRLPTVTEAEHVARRFVALYQGWNSSTVHTDLVEALGLCEPGYAQWLRKDLAGAQFIDRVRQRRIRSEVSFEQVAANRLTRNHATVRVKASVAIFPIGAYHGEPSQTREVDLKVLLSVVPREPQRRPNGLEITQVLAWEG